MPDMHILILINSLTSGGAERVTVNFSSYLVEKGYKATVFTIKNEERDFYMLDRRVARICLDSTQRTWRSNKFVVDLKRHMKRFAVLRVIVRQFRLWGLPFERLSLSRILTGKIKGSDNFFSDRDN